MAFRAVPNSKDATIYIKITIFVENLNFKVSINCIFNETRKLIS